MTREYVIDFLDQQIKNAGGRMNWCKVNGVSNQYLSDVLTLKVSIGPKVLKALKIRKVVSYERVEE